MKLTKDFSLQEFVHPDIYERTGARSASFLDRMLPPTCQTIRDKFGGITINDWLWSGRFIDSGLRLPHGGVGAKFSAHKFGNAADLKFKEVSPIEVQNYIMKHQDKFPHIIRIENAVVTETWLHIETGVRDEDDSIHVFNP